MQQFRPQALTSSINTPIEVEDINCNLESGIITLRVVGFNQFFTDDHTSIANEFATYMGQRIYDVKCISSADFTVQISCDVASVAVKLEFNTVVLQKEVQSNLRGGNKIFHRRRDDSLVVNLLPQSVVLWIVLSLLLFVGVSSLFLYDLI